MTQTGLSPRARNVCQGAHDTVHIVAGEKSLLQLSNTEHQADKKSHEIRMFALTLETQDLLSFIEGNWSPTGDAMVRALRDKGITTHASSPD